MVQQVPAGCTRELSIGRQISLCISIGRQISLCVSIGLPKYNAYLPPGCLDLTYSAVYVVIRQVRKSTEFQQLTTAVQIVVLRCRQSQKVRLSDLPQ